MTDILKEFYYLVDESMPVTHIDTRNETALRATLTDEQIDLLEACLNQRGAQEDRDCQQLFYFALRLGITLAAGDIRTL